MRFAIDHRRRRPIEGIVWPFRQFAKNQTSSGLVLLGCALAAVIWANSPWARSYHELWHLPARIGIGSLHLEKSLRHWINDGLMAVFFFVVGLEIKREILVGELSTRRQAILPVVAALGGMAIPAALYLACNRGGETIDGWGIPMATDIAFVLGVLALLGRRVPTALKVFLAAVAILDDLGAIVIIAVGYSRGISLGALAVGLLFLASLVGANLLHVRSPVPYGLLGLGLWVALLQSGVHPTIAGALTALTIPARPVLDDREFLRHGRQLLGEFERGGEATALKDERKLSAAQQMEDVCEQIETPLQRFEHTLSPWVSFLVMPLFALANAGVTVRADLWTAGARPIMLGVLAGLVVGKPLGILLFSWAATRIRAASLPSGVGWPQLAGVAWLGGIGFTMSIFISHLAFRGAEMEEAKVAILVASTLASLGGLSVLHRVLPPRDAAGADRAAPAEPAANAPGGGFRPKDPPGVRSAGTRSSP